MEKTEPKQHSALILNATNPDAITYTTEELGFTILGGIRLDGLDRMRVTMKIEVVNRKFKHYLNNPEIADLALRHNIDLYNDTQVEKLTRKIAERLEIGSSVITKALADLTTQLETYRLQQIERDKAQIKTQPAKQLTEIQKEDAVILLKSKDLLLITNDLIGRSGVIGEEANRLLMYLIFTSRKRDSPLHVISLGSSGMGKTYLQEKVSELIPQEDKIEITTLSDNAFYYFERTELRNKLILIEDFDGAEGVLYPLRELQSKRKITKTISFKDSKGNTKAIHLTVEGPVSVAGCTTKERLYEDNANRSFLIYLDESPEQDERIMEYQRRHSAGKIDTEQERKAKELMQNCQRILQPLTVRNPFAEQLKIPPEVFKPRRTNSHYLQFIEAVTFYHQYQRQQKTDEETGEVFIETTLEDIQQANRLLKAILLRKSDELSGACRNYFEKLKEHLRQEKQSSFTNKAIRAWLRIPLSTVKRYNLELVNCGYLQAAPSKKNKGYSYEVVSYEEYTTLQGRIANVLDEIFVRLNSSTSAHLSGEPIKPATAKESKPQPNQTGGGTKHPKKTTTDNPQSETPAR